jgi:hypothetical protein
MTFFRDVFKVLISLIREGNHSTEMIRILERILYSNSDIYRLDKLDTPPSYRDQFLPQETPPQEPVYVQISSTNTTSPFYLINVNTFGTLGGYDAIVQRIQNPDHKLPCKDMAMFMRVNDFTKTFLEKNFLASYSIALFNAIHQHVLSFDRNECREQSLEDIIDSLNSLSKMSSLSGVDSLIEKIERFKLDMSLSYLQLPFFEARLKGIENITHLIRVASGEIQINASKNQNSSSSSHHYPGYSSGVNQSIQNYSWQKSTTSSSTTTPSSSILSGNHRPIGPLPKDDLEDIETAMAIAGTLDDMVIKDSSSVPKLVTTPSESSSSTSSAGIIEGGSGKVLPKENQPKMESASTSSQKSPLSVDFMLEWVEENDIINKILTLEHHEALKQGTKILVFLAQHKSLSNRVLESIWGASTLHESLQQVVFRLIIDLLSTIHSDQIDFFYEKIGQLPISAYNTQVLTFIGDFTRKAIRVRADRKEEEKLFGLEIFWRLLTSSNNGQDRTLNAIVNETIDHLEKLLGEYPSQRDVFLRRTLENLRNGITVETSLNLIQRLLKSFKSTEIGAAIVDLDAKEKILDSIIVDLERCKEQKANSKSIQIRLDFLEFLLTQSELMISIEQV